MMPMPIRNRGLSYYLLKNNELAASDAKKACELGNCKTLELVKKNKGLCH